MDDQRSPIYVPPVLAPALRDDRADDAAPRGPEAWASRRVRAAPPPLRRDPLRPTYVAPTWPDREASAADPAPALRTAETPAADSPAAIDEAAPSVELAAPAVTARAPDNGQRRPDWQPAPEIEDSSHHDAAAREIEPVEAPPLPLTDPGPDRLVPPDPEADDGSGRAAPDGRVAWPGTIAPPPQRSRRRLILWLLLILLVVGAVIWIVTRVGHQAGPGGRFQSGATMPVGTALVQKGDMPIILSGLGTVTPLATVTVKTQLNGQLIEVGFQEGQRVNKGDFLAQIDPRPYQVALEQAQGQLAKDQAALADAELDLKRYHTLVAQNSIATQTLDTQAATVQQDKATIQADQAQVDVQKLNLVYCHIISPVAGRVGLRQVDPGNYVQTTDTNGIVIVTQLQPISVIFTLPEDNLPEVLKQIHAGVTLQATAFDRSGTTKLAVGKLETVDNEIDTTTGTVKLRAIFDNESDMLFPNQFVNVQLLVSTLQNTDIVPVSAIERGAPGTFVYVVKPDDTVAVQTVKLGPTDGQRQAVVGGLQPGQKIVTDGADRLKEGAKVSEVAARASAAAAKTDNAAAGANSASGSTPAGGTSTSTSPAPAGTGQSNAESGQNRQGAHQGHQHSRSNSE